jgi:hypothetical protein
MTLPASRIRRSTVAVVVLSFATIFLLGGKWHSQRRLDETLRRNASEQGLRIEGGSFKAGFFSSQLRNFRFSMASAPGITFSVSHATIDHAWFGPSRITLENLDVRLEGSLAQLFESGMAMPDWRGIPLVLAPADVTYQDRVVGLLSLKGATLKRGPSLRIEARRLEVGKGSWPDVVLWIEKRNQMIAVYPCGQPSEDHCAFLANFSTKEGTLQWDTRIVSQKLGPLARRLGWNLGREFDLTQVSGTLSLSKDDPTSALSRNSAQFIFDRWPMPAWPQTESLLGTTLSFFANVKTSPDFLHFTFPKIELTMPLYSLAGSGELHLDQGGKLIIDSAGTRTCAQLRERMAPSPFKDQVAKFLDDHPQKSTEATRLGLRFEVANRPEAKPVISWHFDPGCGLDGWEGAPPSTPEP